MNLSDLCRGLFFLLINRLALSVFCLLKFALPEAGCRNEVQPNAWDQLKTVLGRHLLVRQKGLSTQQQEHISKISAGRLCSSAW